MDELKLRNIANQLRVDVLEMVVRAGAGHVAGPLSSADIIASLFFGGEVRYKASQPWWEMRDRIVLSCGHYCPVLYAALARARYFPLEMLEDFMQPGSGLPGHPEARSIAGVEVSAGPLGQGVSVAVGMATALKLKYAEMSRAQIPRVYCLLSDGELQEGQVWEAFNFAVRRQLENLIFIVDQNRVQIGNYVSQVVTEDNLPGRLEAFGLYTLVTDGHEYGEIAKTFKLATEAEGAPAVIVAETIAGRGVSFMERKPEWHDKVPDLEELKSALAELRHD